MNERDLIATQTIRFVSEGADSVRANMKGIAAAQGELAASTESLAVVTETSARRQTSAASAFQALARRTDPATRALAEFEAAQKRVSMALDQGVVSQGRALEVLGSYAQKANAAAVAQENLRRQQANASVNQGSGFTPGVASSLLSEADIKANDHMTESVNRLRGAMRPLEVEQGNLGKEMVYYRGLMKSGAITADEFAEKQTMLGKRLSDVSQNLKIAGTAGRVMSGELANMSFQLNDVVTGLALGQSPFMIIAQQGGQVIQILQQSKATVAEFAKTAVSSFMSIFTAGRVAVGGVIGLGVGIGLAASEWKEGQREIERSLIGIGARTGSTVADINKFAMANSSATGLSVDQARTAAIEFTKTGDITVGKLKGLGEAVHGYSILTGRDATDATKDLAQALSGDLVKGAQQLSQTYGFLNPAMEDNIRKLVNQGERAKAQQIIINAMASDNKRAEATVSDLAKAWEFLGNTYSKVKNVVGSALNESPDEELNRLKGLQRRNPDALPSRVRNRIPTLESQSSDAGFNAFEKEQNRVANAADAATKAIIPQIKAIDDLKAKYAELGAAQDEAGSNKNNGAAQQAIQNQIAALTESQGEAERYNARVAEISKSWGNVGQSTALALQAAQNQLPVIEAVGGAAKMAAQYAADYANAMDKGKTATEASALAGSNLQAAQAAVNSAAKETLWNLQNQAEASAAVTGAQQIAAQGRATYNELIRAGVSATQAEAIAAQQVANARAKATASVLEQVHSLEQSTEMIKAQANGTEATVAASQAYDNAMRSGASSSAAAALSAATLENHLTKAAIEANKMAEAESKAATAAYSAAGGNFGQAGGYSSSEVKAGKQYVSTSNLGYFQLTVQSWEKTASDLASSILAAGGSIDDAIKKAQNVQPSNVLQQFGIQSVVTESDTVKAVGDLYNLKVGQASDPTQKLTILNEEFNWLQSHSGGADTLQAMVDVTNAIKELTGSTDSLNNTNQELLSPYYTQDPRTSHIGFRSQGMASGGEFVVPGGYSSNDNMIGQIPLASGEVVSVRRPGEGGASGGGVVVHMQVIVQGNANKDDVGRTLYQSGQNLARQLRASGQ